MPVDDAAREAKDLARDDLPGDIEYELLDAQVMGDPHRDEYLSVEVEVCFPGVDSESALPDRSALFPRADGVSYLAIDAVDS